ncbi:30S ribosomal protein S20 [Bombilactobacillus thymidiniphilus]|uniref:Small ribosomal subunit protein bS20 n=1 Tax=Bombilactobacillus thymidiniphilus TaxID=2923363 RepID=A0ABY4PDK1_9LACO|nr:30S ribosomal protein S20 [Bombilactobacillus thymidiniphilus]UQS83753.1 30S ribosomal protein S20 [Bombilactobacillus thymidiniphilus]
MPQIKSAIKRVKTSAKANERNSAQRSAMRSAVKKFDAAVANDDANKQELYQQATRAIDMAKSKGLIKQNKAARDKSRLAAKINN